MKIFLSAFFSVSLLLNGLYSNESAKYYTLESIENEESAWSTYYNTTFQLKFPSSPSIDIAENTVSYSAAESDNFPISIYNLTIFMNESVIDIEKLIEEIFTNSNTRHTILWSDFQEIENGIILDLISCGKNPYLMRKERLFIFEKEIYSLSTHFFSIGIENHDYFIESFVLFE